MQPSNPIPLLILIFIFLTTIYLSAKSYSVSYKHTLTINEDDASIEYNKRLLENIRNLESIILTAKKSHSIFHENYRFNFKDNASMITGVFFSLRPINKDELEKDFGLTNCTATVCQPSLHFSFRTIFKDFKQNERCFKCDTKF